jgi:ATP-dependent exoDNAse (exonuclease V) beta subunit
MMTFTKKASGEMNTRIVERFRIQSEFEGPDKLFWKIANDMLSVLTVTTIHGFCFQLIRNGIFTDFFHDAKIISETEKSSKVKKLFDDWFTFSLSNFDQSQINLIIREKKYLLSAFNRIFNDPEIRISWRELDFEKIQPSSMDKILSNSFDLNGLSRSIDNFKSLNLDDENNHSAFEKIVYIFQKSGPDIVDSLEKFKIYADLFESIKRLDGERTHKKKTPPRAAPSPPRHRGGRETPSRRRARTRGCPASWTPPPACASTRWKSGCPCSSRSVSRWRSACRRRASWPSKSC